LVDECLAKDPAVRLPSMQDVAIRVHGITHKKSRTGSRLA
jgi:hypothetical protein